MISSLKKDCFELRRQIKRYKRQLISANISIVNYEDIEEDEFD